MISLPSVLTERATVLLFVPQFAMRSRSRAHLAYRLLAAKFYAIVFLSLSTSLAQAQQRSPLADAKPILVEGCCVLNLSEHWEISEGSSDGKLIPVSFAEAISRPLKMPMEAEYLQDNYNLGLAISIHPAQLGKDKSQANTKHLSPQSLQKIAESFKADIDKYAKNASQLMTYTPYDFEPTQLIKLNGGAVLLRDAYKVKSGEWYYHQVYRYWAGASSFELEIQNDTGLSEDMQALMPNIHMNP